MARIVLVHGILGFGDLFPLQPKFYFNGIRPLFERLGHQVLCPNLAALGPVSRRAPSLASQIDDFLRTGDQTIFLLAHSMGGLDCRRMLVSRPDLAAKVKRLITVATPHAGSPVADEVLDPGLFGVLNPAKAIIGAFGNEFGAVDNLTTYNVPRDPDVAGVDYQCVGCDGGPPHRSLFFAAAAGYGGFGATRNDGVVSLASASRTGNAADLDVVWPVDHGGAIGWPSSPLEGKDALGAPPPVHIARYQALLKRLVA